MFLDHYGLREQPFGVTPNPRYLYLSPTHREALASLAYGIEAGRGFVGLIAKPGMGKTTLLFQLLERLANVARTVFLFQTQCEPREFVRSVLTDLGLDTTGDDLAGMQAKLTSALLSELRAGRQFVLVLDEAQNLEDPVLEVVRMLSNFETAQAKLMQIVLAGQPQLADKLARPSMMQLRQRISIVSQLQPLSRSETSDYIDHRLRVAGYKGGSLFTSGARTLIASASDGIPRRINNLCFGGLSLGYATGHRSVDAQMIREVSADLDLTKMGTAAATPSPSETTVAAGPVAGEGRGGWAVVVDRILSTARRGRQATFHNQERSPIEVSEGGGSAWKDFRAFELDGGDELILAMRRKSS